MEIQSSSNFEWFSAEYDSFYINSEALGYAIHVTGYSGDAGDGINYTQASSTALINGMKFSTYDQNNGRCSCAGPYLGGWWYNCCMYANLNADRHFYWHPLFIDGLAPAMYLMTGRMMIALN